MNPEKSGEKNTRRRVKVYKLNDEGQWDDVGTGHVTCVHHETFDALALVVKSEEKGGENILESKIQIEDIYQLQQDTLIVWQEPETGLDLALSFQEEQGCKEVWEQICAVQGRNPSESSEEVVTEEEESYFNGIKLPPANLNNLQKMNGVFDGEHNSHTKERLANTVTRENYLSKLIDLFKVVEESGNQEHLHLMFNIFKNLVLLNDPNLLETMFNDQNFMASVGALEYDPEVSPKLEHRKYLQNSVIFKEVVPIRNAEILKKIHQTFRVQYLKDVILPRLLDDMTFATINSIIYFNNVEIVDHLYKDTTFLIELFSKFKAASNDDLVDLLGFLQEFCSLAKNLQIPQQRDFYQALARHGMFEIFESALAEPNIKIRLSCADLVNNVLSHDPVHFREFLMAQRPDYVLFQKLVDRVLLETDVGLLSQFVEVIRILVDTETMEETPDKEKFLTLFYQTFMKGLMAPIMDVDAREREGADPAEFEMKSARRQELCELLAYCCQHHGYHIKYFILGNNIAAKVAKLLSHLQPKHVSLAALRFFRALVAAKDEFYNRHIIKFKLFDPIVQLFVANGKKYNLINSAVIELFDYIRKDNVKPLLKHVMENYAEVFKEVDYVETFKLLQLKYEQNKDHEENANKAYAAPTKSPQRAAGDDVDDSYFFGDDDDEEETAPSGLVAYEDDENSSRVAEEVGKGKRKWEGEKVEAEQELREEEEEEEEEEDGGKEAPSLNEPVVTNGDASEAYDPSKKRKRPAAANHSGGGDGKAAEGDGSSSSSTATSETKEEGGQGEEDGAKDMKEVNEGSSGGVAASTMGSTETGEKERDPKRLKFAIQSPKLPKISTSDS